MWNAALSGKYHLALGLKIILDTRDTRGEVMFPLHVGILIKTNNQIKFDSQQIHQPHLFRVRHDP